MGGKYNSSKTRVAPVFTALAERRDAWLQTLLGLGRFGSPTASLDTTLDWTPTQLHWDPNELPLDPPLGLLSWLVRNFRLPPGKTLGATPTDSERAKLAAGDPDAVARALRMLRNSAAPSGWHILEGPTYPDAVIFTPDVVVVVEGKRTEAGPTLDTTWLPGRHQMIRHLDAAWEIRGRRRLYGLLVVEAGSGSESAIPGHWQAAALATWSDAALAGSLPHRSPEERLGIRDAFVGATTWQSIVTEFDLASDVLRETA